MFQFFYRVYSNVRNCKQTYYIKVKNKLLWLSTKNVVVGIGEIVEHFFKIISKAIPTVVYVKNQKLVDKIKLKKYIRS